MESSQGGHAIGNSDFADYPIHGFESEFLEQWSTGILSTPNTDGSVFDPTVLSPLATTGVHTPVSNPGFGSMDHSFESGPETALPAGFDDANFFHGDFSKDFNPPPERPHSCLSLALNILPMLCISPPRCKLLSVSPCIHQSFNIEHVISTNRKIIESISVMLDCPCSLDGQLDFILALITFQILAWYDAAAKDVNGTHPNHNPRQASEQIQDFPTAVRNYQLDAVHDQRMRAQLIFNELDRVVRFVDLLLNRFEEARSRTGIDVLTDNSALDAGGTKIGRLSASILVQLEADITQRLQAVANTMAILRNG